VHLRYKAVQERASPPPGTRLQDVVSAATSASAAAAAAAAEAKRVLDELVGGRSVEALQEQSQQLDVDAPVLLQHLPK
jgi:hypothetical protein